MGDGDNYGDVQQPAGGYADAGAGGAGAPTGYGDVQNPASPYDKKAVPAPPPADPITQVKSDLKALNVGLQGASLIDMKSHRNHTEFEGIGFLAWTNSSQAIFINLLGFPGNPVEWRAAALVAVRHELVHVRQFKSTGGPPKTFKKMISFEAEAYPETVRFMDDKNTKAFFTGIGATSFNEIHKTLDEEGKAFAAEEKVKATEPDYLKWLTDPKNHGGFLPATIDGKTYNIPGPLYKDK